MTTSKDTTALAKSGSVQALDELASDAVAVATSSQMGPFARAITTGEIMQRIRTELGKEGILDAVSHLAGSAVGFRTDKQYTPQQLVDPIIEATMLGLPYVGNRFNVIAGRCYVTKEGFGLLLSQLNGLAYEIIPGVPHTANGGKGATVSMHVKAEYRGRKIDTELEICVRVNTGMGADAIIGKATRKARKWLYETATGCEVPDGDTETDDMGKDVTGNGSDKPKETVSDRMKGEDFSLELDQ